MKLIITLYTFAIAILFASCGEKTTPEQERLKKEEEEIRKEIDKTQEELKKVRDKQKSLDEDFVLGIDIDKMADEYCACMKESDVEKSAACIKEWTDKYKDIKGTEEEGNKLAAKISNCQ